MLVHLIEDSNLDDELGLEFCGAHICWITDISLISFKLTESVLKSQCCQILDLQIKRRNNNLRGKNLVKVKALCLGSL